MNKISTLALVAALGLATPAFAQIPNDPGHPRVNEVDQRLNNQQQRIDQGEKNGTMTQGQATRDEKRDQRIENQEKTDEAKHGGHLTKGEQRHLNREENRNSHDIHRQKEHGRERERHARREERRHHEGR